VENPLHPHTHQNTPPPPLAERQEPGNGNVEQFAHQALAQWAANIADRIKNPVAGISAAMEIIEKQFAGYMKSNAFDETVMARAIDLTRTRLDILNQYVSDVVTVAQPTKIVPRIVDPQSLLTELVESTLAGTDWTGHINISVNPEVKWIMCDPEKILTMLRALITNSVEAVDPSRQPDLAIGVRYHTDPDGQKKVVLSVCDNGHGIDQEHLHRVKLPFFTTKEARAGFGMALVEKIAAAHDGRIAISKCDELKGAQVSVILPASPQARTQHQT